jgi:hypothetical protein
MKFDAKHFAVDFRKAPESRWDELLTDTWARGKARTLASAVFKQMNAGLGVMSRLVATIARDLAGRSQGELDYLEDMEVWSEWAVGDLSQVILANFSYELHQTRGGFGSGLTDFRRRFGFCTSVAFHQPKLGMVHARNVDWPLPQMKSATVVLDCKSAAGPFQAVSVPGMVGVLSGVAKGRFSITVNSKEDRSHYVPNIAGWGATLLVRWILEYCSSYDEALRKLSKAYAFVPFYVMLVGLKQGQAVVVEISRNGKNRVYNQPGNALGLANHYPGELCEDEEMDSQERQDLVEARAARCRAKSLRGCFSVVSEFPVMHAGTVQSMVLHPKSGEVLLQQT